MEHETFWTLIKDAAHWEFELFLIFLFDVVIGFLLLPKMKRWVTHHESDDQKVARLENQMKEVREKLGIKDP